VLPETMWGISSRAGGAAWGFGLMNAENPNQRMRLALKDIWQNIFD
jgi:hypothetical protein